MNTDILRNTRVTKLQDSPIQGNPCYEYNPKGLRRLFIIISTDDERKKSGWEHVSVSVLKDPGSCPTWHEMEAVKRLCWGENVACMQWHAAESDYFHGFMTTRNHAPIEVLHIWRPADGDWSKLTEKGPDAGTVISDEIKEKVVNKLVDATKLAAKM